MKFINVSYDISDDYDDKLKLSDKSYNYMMIKNFATGTVHNILLEDKR